MYIGVIASGDSGQVNGTKLCGDWNKGVLCCWIELSSYSFAVNCMHIRKCDIRRKSKGSEGYQRREYSVDTPQTTNTARFNVHPTDCTEQQQRQNLPVSARVCPEKSARLRRSRCAAGSRACQCFEDDPPLQAPVEQQVCRRSSSPNSGHNQCGDGGLPPINTVNIAR